MRGLAFGMAALLAGCSSMVGASAHRSAEIARVQQQSRELERDDRECESAESEQDQAAILLVASCPESFTSLQEQSVLQADAGYLAGCKAEVDRKRELLGSSELAEYQREAQEERNNNTLIMILTTSLTH